MFGVLKNIALKELRNVGCGSQVYVRLRPLNAKASHAKHRAVAEESIVATSDVQLTLHPPQNAKR